jgi:hypothetical protein
MPMEMEDKITTIAVDDSNNNMTAVNIVVAEAMRILGEQINTYRNIQTKATALLAFIAAFAVAMGAMLGNDVFATMGMLIKFCYSIMLVGLLSSTIFIWKVLRAHKLSNGISIDKLNSLFLESDDRTLQLEIYYYVYESVHYNEDKVLSSARANYVTALTIGLIFASLLTITTASFLLF